MKIKRLTAWALCLLLIFSLAPAALADGEDATEIGSAEELARIALDPAGSYVLTADLDMAGIDWVPMAFAGKLDGAGHTIFNLSVTAPGEAVESTVDGNSKRYSAVFAGLFSTLTNAEIRDLNLLGVDLDVETEAHCFAAALAGYMENSLIANCTVSDARITLTLRCQDGVAGKVLTCMGGVGGLAGFGYGSIFDSDVESVLVFHDESARGVKCEQFMGGLLACGNAVVSGCRIVINGYDACRGYAHNGGVMGMSYRYYDDAAAGSITGCTVDGQITFFEDNPDHRAYCEAYIGEMYSYCSIEDSTPNFTVNHLYDYSKDPVPEQCDEPQYTQEVRSEPCQWGCTVHTCAGCGYSWRDSFTAPVHSPGEWTTVQEATYEDSGLRRQSCTLCGAVLSEEVVNPHVPGDWVVTREAGYGTEGLRQKFCLDCGAVLEEEILPALIPMRSVVITPAEIEIMYGDSYLLTVETAPDDADNPILHWDTTDRRIATIDTNGTVHGTGRGTAVITCTSADGFASAQCTVTVKYTTRQWLVHYVLFGWLWDR